MSDNSHDIHRDPSVDRQGNGSGNGSNNGNHHGYHGPQENGQSKNAGTTQAGGKEARQTLRPPVDVIEDRDGITLLADLPGISRDRLNLHVEADSITIEGEMMLDLPEQMASRFAEVSVPRYRRTFKLSRDLDAEQASAELKNGVLRLRIPKAQHAQPRRIQISAG